MLSHLIHSHVLHIYTYYSLFRYLAKSHTFHDVSMAYRVALIRYGLRFMASVLCHATVHLHLATSRFIARIIYWNFQRCLSGATKDL
jgi:hypothetical protein